MQKTRSSLANHSFPPFYACYLLKSIRTPRSIATYIGSTPNPPRRIRQHNGEIAQGAWKTKHNRPWVMQMIVHGFSSKLAALQFEWAWQHPHISRHLRDGAGKSIFIGKSKHLKTSIQIVHTMIFTHPYRSWPLHVKLFTAEALKSWQDVTKDAMPLPSGFTCSIELEGVDGKSGMLDSGRKGPIDVSDELFTAPYLTKHASLLASKHPLNCSVCHETITDYLSKPLEVVLCPVSHCTAVSHMLCLSESYLDLHRENGSVGMVPRGGKCPSCHTYVLWGDYIRGCYRRLAGGAVSEPEDEDDDVAYKFDYSSLGEGSAAPDEHRNKPLNAYVGAAKRKQSRKPRDKAVNLESDNGKGGGSALRRRPRKGSPSVSRLTTMPGSDTGSVFSYPQRGKKARTILRSRATPRTYHSNAFHNSDTSGEFFDLNAISSDDEEDGAIISLYKPPVSGNRQPLDRRGLGFMGSRCAPRPSSPVLCATEDAAKRRPKSLSVWKEWDDVLDVVAMETNHDGGVLTAAAIGTKYSATILGHPESATSKPGQLDGPRTVRQERMIDPFLDISSEDSDSGGRQHARIVDEDSAKIEGSTAKLTRTLSILSISSPRGSESDVSVAHGRLVQQGSSQRNTREMEIIELSD